MKLTTGEVAKILGFSQGLVVRLIDSGDLRGFRIPGSTHRRVFQADLDKFIQENNIPIDRLQDRPTEQPTHS